MVLIFVSREDEDKIIGFTCGAFDLCHAGHILMFRNAKSLCDYLIVGLQEDPSVDRPDTKNRPIMSVKERLIILEGIKYIDEIFTYKTEKDLYNWLKKNQKRIDVRILGEDWKGKKITGQDLSIKIYFNKRTHKFSTTELRDRVYSVEKIRRS